MKVIRPYATDASASAQPRSSDTISLSEDDRPRDDTLRARRPLYIATILVLVASLVLQQSALFLTGLLLAVLALLPEIWYRFGLRALTLDTELSTARAEFGDTLEVTVVVENRKLLPLPWLQVDDEFPDELPVIGVHLDPTGRDERARLRNTLALWAYQRVRRRVRVRAAVRGAYQFGPIAARVTDPFGILVQEGHTTKTASLLVYPLIAPIERFGLEARALFGERATPQRLLEDPLRIAGVRAYAPGDEPRRIHWKATARTGSLQSKIYEPSSRHTVVIFLDTRTFRNALFGAMPELVELATSAAASVAVWAMEQGYSVGLMSNGTLSAVGEELGAQGGSTFRLRVPPSARPEQFALLLSGLARLQPHYVIPIEQVMAGEQPRLARGSSVIYIGAEAMLDVPVILQLRRLRSLGHSVTLLLSTGDVESGGREDEHVIQLPNLPTHYLGGVSAWHELVADVLGPGALRRASSSLAPDLSPAERTQVLAGVHIRPADNVAHANGRGSNQPGDTLGDTLGETPAQNGRNGRSEHGNATSGAASGTDAGDSGQPRALVLD